MVVMPTRIMWCLSFNWFSLHQTAKMPVNILRLIEKFSPLVLFGKCFVAIGDRLTRQVIKISPNKKIQSMKNSDKKVFLWEISMTTTWTNQFDDILSMKSLINFIDVFLLCSHNTRTTQWEDPRIQAAAAALSHGNLFSSSEHSSVETLFSSPTQLSSLGSSNGKHLICIYFFPLLFVTLKQKIKAKRKD